MKQRFVNVLAWALLGMSLIAAQSVQADEWEWIVAPYIWAQDVGLDLSIDGDPVFDGSASFDNLVDKIDMAFMGHFEGRKDRWGMYLDTIYVDLSESKSVPVGPGGPILGDFSVDASFKLKIYDAGGLYRLSDANSETRVDLLAGVRYVDLDVGTTFTFPGPGMDQIQVNSGPSDTDFMVGVRLAGNFSPKWHWLLRGDTSFGGTEGTYNGLAAFGYTFGESGLFSMDLGYRYMSIDIDGNSPRGASTEADIVLSGPVLGLIFAF